jgi:hypothetical protein
MSFDEEHLDDHYLCQREVAERDQRIRELEAALKQIAEYQGYDVSALKDIAGAALEVTPTPDREAEHD